MDNTPAFPSIRFERNGRIFNIYYNAEYVGDLNRFMCTEDREPIGASRDFINTCENLKMIISDNLIDTMKFMDSAARERKPE